MMKYVASWNHLALSFFSFLDLLRTVRPICLHMEKRLHLTCSGCASDILQYQVCVSCSPHYFTNYPENFTNSENFTICFCFSGFRMFAAMVASTTHRRHLMVQKIFTPRFIFEAAGFGVSLATMCLSYLTFVRIRGSISKYVKALWLEIIRINTQSNIVLTIYIPGA